MFRITQEHRDALKEIAQLLDNEIGSFLDEKGQRVGAFIRMDTRSPKVSIFYLKFIFDFFSFFKDAVTLVPKKEV